MKSAFVCRVFFILFALFIIVPTICADAETLELDGVIEPHLVVKIGSPVPGVLEKVSVDRGELVEKNQIIATLQSGVERASMELARARTEMNSTIRAREAQLEFNLRKQKRFEELEKMSVIPFEEMDEARTNSRISLLELEEA